MSTARQLLSVSNTDAFRLRDLPINLQSRAAERQTHQHWIPTILGCFGSLERFLFYFITSPDGKQALRALFESGSITDIVEDCMHNYMMGSIRKWRDKEQKLYDSNSVEALYGTNLSER